MNAIRDFSRTANGRWWQHLFEMQQHTITGLSTVASNPIPFNTGGCRGELKKTSLELDHGMRKSLKIAMLAKDSLNDPHDSWVIPMIFVEHTLPWPPELRLPHCPPRCLPQCQSGEPEKRLHPGEFDVSLDDLKHPENSWKFVTPNPGGTLGSCFWWWVKSPKSWVLSDLSALVKPQKQKQPLAAGIIILSKIPTSN